MTRVTFSLDDETAAVLRRTAARVRKPQSHVVREAIAEYAARSGKMSEADRTRVLEALETLRHTRPSRSAATVDSEIADVRARRRRGGRRTRSW